MVCYNLQIFISVVDFDKHTDTFDSEKLVFCLLTSHMASFYYDFDKAKEFREVCEAALGINVCFDGNIFVLVSAPFSPPGN